MFSVPKEHSDKVIYLGKEISKDLTKAVDIKKNLSAYDGIVSAFKKSEKNYMQAANAYQSIVDMEKKKGVKNMMPSEQKARLGSLKFVKKVCEHFISETNAFAADAKKLIMDVKTMRLEAHTFHAGLKLKIKQEYEERLKRLNEEHLRRVKALEDEHEKDIQRMEVDMRDIEVLTSIINEDIFHLSESAKNTVLDAREAIQEIDEVVKAGGAKEVVRCWHLDRLSKEFRSAANQ